jgi:hypothetical protein
MNGIKVKYNGGKRYIELGNGTSYSTRAWGQVPSAEIFYSLPAADIAALAPSRSDTYLAGAAGCGGHARRPRREIQEGAQECPFYG